MAIYLALLAQHRLVAAASPFWTITEYYVVTQTWYQVNDRCTTSCDTVSGTYTVAVKPTVTPTATPISSYTTTDHYTYGDVEIVSVLLPASAVAGSDLVNPSDYLDFGFPEFDVPVTYTAPASCPTPFTVATYTQVLIPPVVATYISATSTATSITTWTWSGRSDSLQTNTYITMFLPQSAVPTSTLNPTDDYIYNSYVQNCVNPTAPDAAYYGPSSTATRGGGSSGSNDSDRTVCSPLSACAGTATWVIAVATVLPAVFLLGFVESYCWFRRMMLGKSALRLGTVCWCALSLWFILLTRRVPARSTEDQALLKQYWASLGASTRLKYWFKWGFRWKYPVELLGNVDGSTPAMVALPPASQWPQFPGRPDHATGNDGSDKTPANTQQHSMYMPYPGQPYVLPVSGQPYPTAPGFPPPQGHIMVPVPPARRV